MYKNAHDVNPVAFPHAENFLPHDLGRISDVKGLHTPHPTVRHSQDETPTITHDNPHALPSTPATLKPNQNPNTKMARSPNQHVRRITRRQYDHQEQNMKKLQIRILQKLHHIQHFNICNNAPVTTVSMALYRRNMALNVRDHINTATALLDQEPLELPDASRFRHYHAMFTYFRGMVYREEIRLDKIIDDLQEFVQYTQDHGVPRPPIQPNLRLT
jgi:hypothetical protein